MHIHVTLLESAHARAHREGGAAASLLIHAAFITLFAQFGFSASKPFVPAVVEKLTFVEPVKRNDAPEPPPPERVPVRAVGDGPVITGPPTAKGFQILTAPIAIPTALPEVDLSRAITREEDFSGRGVAGGIAAGVIGGVVRPLEEADRVVATRGPTYREEDVDKPAALRPDNPPLPYPESMRNLGLTGTVTVRFVIDTAGRADMQTLHVIRSTHADFTMVLRNALPEWRFHPAEVGGRKVRVLVELPVEFNLVR